MRVFFSGFRVRVNSKQFITGSRTKSAGISLYIRTLKDWGYWVSNFLGFYYKGLGSEGVRFWDSFGEFSKVGGPF